MDPSSFLKLLEDFINDLRRVFNCEKAESEGLVCKMLSKQVQYINLCKENLSAEEIVKRHFDKLVEYEKAIIAADESIFDTDSEIYMLKYVDFSVVWKAQEMTQKNKGTTMKYLQTLLTIGKINQNGGMESIQDMLDQMKQFKPVDNVDTTKGTNVLNRLMDDVSKDMEGIDLGIDESKIDPNNVDIGSIMQQLMGGGKSQDIMSVVTNLATKLQQQVESGEVSQEELAAAAQNMMSGMGGNGGLGGINMGAIMQMMGGMGGMGAGQRLPNRAERRAPVLEVAPGSEEQHHSSSRSSYSGKRGKGGKKK